MSIIFWIPIVLTIAGILLGLSKLPRTTSGWWALLESSAPRFGIVGITVLFAFAGANVLATTGLPEQLTGLLGDLNLPLWALAILVGLIVIAVSRPVASSRAADVGVYAPDATGLAKWRFCCSSRASAATAQDVDPFKTFARLFLYYALPLLAIGVLIALGILPV